MVVMAIGGQRVGVCVHVCTRAIRQCPQFYHTAPQLTTSLRDIHMYCGSSHTLIQKHADYVVGADLAMHANVHTDMLTLLEDRHLKQLFCHNRSLILRRNEERGERSN